MDAKQYINLIEVQNKDAGEVGDIVAKLPREERGKLFNELRALNYNKLVRTLWFDYETQTFITQEQEQE